MGVEKGTVDKLKPWTRTAIAYKKGGNNLSDPIRANDKHPFEYQKPNAEQVVRIEAVRQGCRALLDTLMVNVLSSRERSLAITKLEEVSCWANKAIVFEDPIMARLTSEIATQPGK